MQTNGWKVFFSHGKESGPWGTKIVELASVARGLGFEVESLDYTDLTDPKARVERLIAAAAGYPGEKVLVGSSMGGYVATVASGRLRPAGIFLMAPAFYLPGYDEQDPTPVAGKVAVVHGWEDEVVPVENTIRYAEKHRTDLHLIHDDHRLVGHLDVIVSIFHRFLEDVRR